MKKLLSILVRKPQPLRVILKSPLRLTCLCLAGLLILWATAQEKVTLTTPVLTDAGVTDLRVTLLYLDWPNQLITIQLRALADSTGTNYLNRPPLEFRYEGTNAINLLKILNTNRFDTVSLNRKIILKLQNDGKLGSGSLSGSPE